MAPSNSQPSPEQRNDVSENRRAVKRPRPAPTGPQGQPLPVREGAHGRGLIIGIMVALAIGGGLLLQAVRVTTKAPKNVKLGSSDIEISRDAKQLAKRVAADGPRLYPGLAGSDADFWLNQVNGQWFAFAAHIAGTGRECNTTWRPDLGKFADGCIAGKLYGPTGEGLPQYSAFEEDNGVYVNLTSPPAK